MSLKHAILGFLNYKPFSGYDLKGAFDVSVQHFWTADQSQIYRTLTRMAKDGLVKLEVIEQEDRPNRKLYHITDAGREELNHWISTPLKGQKYRSALLIQVFFAGLLSDEEVLEMFERVAAQIRAGLARFEEVPALSAPYAEIVGSPREDYFWMLTLECGIEMARAELVWLEDVIARIKSGEIPQM
jgi:DNA-binding PadR family transcriptional regulator